MIFHVPCLLPAVNVMGKHRIPYTRAGFLGYYVDSFFFFFFFFRHEWAFQST